VRVHTSPEFASDSNYRFKQRVRSDDAKPPRRGNERCSLADAEGEAVDGGDLTAFRFKTLPTQEFLVHEQAIEETSTRRSRSLIPIFNATTD
jgi:hypothetical protein